MECLCFMIPWSVLFLQPMEDNAKGNYNFSILTPSLGSMWYTQMRANVEKPSIHITQILDSGPPWGSHNPFRISAQSPSTSINWMQRVERESLGCKKNQFWASVCMQTSGQNRLSRGKQTKGKSWISLHSSYYVTNEPFILNQCVLQLHLIIVSET